MSDLLNQSEVQALLAAIEAGHLAMKAGAAGTPSPEQPRAGHDATPGGPRPIHELSDSLHEALTTLHATFCQEFAEAMTEDLRTSVRVSISNIFQTACGEFLQSLPKSACVYRLTAGPLDGELGMEWSPNLFYAVIDRLLGGNGVDRLLPTRAPSALELRLARPVVDRAAKLLSAAWSNVTPASYLVQDFESNPRLVQIALPHECIVVIVFEIGIERQNTSACVCIPRRVLDPMVGVLMASGERPRNIEEQFRQLTSQVRHTMVEVRCLLARTTINMNELLSLQVGDLIATGQHADAPVFIDAAGRKLFPGQAAHFRGQRAIRITGPATTTAPANPATNYSQDSESRDAK